MNPWTSCVLYLVLYAVVRPPRQTLTSSSWISPSTAVKSFPIVCYVFISSYLPIRTVLGHWLTPLPYQSAPSSTGVTWSKVVTWYVRMDRFFGQAISQNQKALKISLSFEKYLISCEIEGSLTVMGDRDAMLYCREKLIQEQSASNWSYCSRYILFSSSDTQRRPTTWQKKRKISIFKLDQKFLSMEPKQKALLMSKLWENVPRMRRNLDNIIKFCQKLRKQWNTLEANRKA